MRLRVVAGCARTAPETHENQEEIRACSFFDNCFLRMVLGISGCSSKCPPDGKWKTGDTLGLIGFEVSSCQIKSIGVAVDVSQLPNQFGDLFAQDYVRNYGSTYTKAFWLECPIDQNWQSKCQQDVTLAGKFLSDSEAQGELFLSIPWARILQLGFP
jgi:hypothetical protein